MRAAIAALALAACGGGNRSNHLDVAQVALIGGAGCAPEVAHGTVPTVFGVGGESVRIGLSFADPWTFEPVAPQAGSTIEVFEQDASGSPEPQGAPIATGVVNGQGIGVIDWRPTARQPTPGEADALGLIVVLEGMDPSPSILAHVLRPHPDRADVLCAWVTDEQGQRIAGVGNGATVRFRAIGRGLPADATFLFEVAPDEVFSGPAVDGAIDLPGRILLPSSAFDVNGRAFHRVYGGAGSAADPDFGRGLGIDLLVVR